MNKLGVRRKLRSNSVTPTLSPTSLASAQHSPSIFSIAMSNSVPSLRQAMNRFARLSLRASQTPSRQPCVYQASRSVAQSTQRPSRANKHGIRSFSGTPNRAEGISRKIQKSRGVRIAVRGTSTHPLTSTYSHSQRNQLGSFSRPPLA